VDIFKSISDRAKKVPHRAVAQEGQGGERGDEARADAKSHGGCDDGAAEDEAEEAEAEAARQRREVRRVHHRRDEVGEHEVGVHVGGLRRSKAGGQRCRAKTQRVRALDFNWRERSPESVKQKKSQL
jgi:hypothetical protein